MRCELFCRIFGCQCVYSERQAVECRAFAKCKCPNKNMCAELSTNSVAACRLRLFLHYLFLFVFSRLTLSVSCLAFRVCMAKHSFNMFIAKQKFCAFGRRCLNGVRKLPKCTLFSTNSEFGLSCFCCCLFF